MHRIAPKVVQGEFLSGAMSLDARIVDQNIDLPALPADRLKTLFH
jgi:hypothetical protein